MIPIEQKAPPGDRTAAEWNDVANATRRRRRACEKTKVFSCVLFLMDVIVVILHKKGYSSPYPIRMLL